MLTKEQISRLSRKIKSSTERAQKETTTKHSCEITRRKIETRTTHQRIICKSHCQQKKPLWARNYFNSDVQEKKHITLRNVFFSPLFRKTCTSVQTSHKYTLSNNNFMPKQPKRRPFLPTWFWLCMSVCMCVCVCIVIVSQIAFIPVIFLTRNDEHWIQLQKNEQRNTQTNKLTKKATHRKQKRKKWFNCKFCSARDCDCSLWRRWLSIFVLLYGIFMKIKQLAKQNDERVRRERSRGQIISFGHDKWKNKNTHIEIER